jgi:hypothetical protein
MNDISWLEFVESEFAGQAVSSNTRYYRDAWNKILERANAGSASVSDRKSISVISGTRYFNWAAFFFGPYWAVWRGMRYCWWMMSTEWILVLLADVIPRTAKFGAEAGIWIICALFGTSWYLIKVATRREDRVESLRPSLLRLAIGLGGTFIGALVYLL